MGGRMKPKFKTGLILLTSVFALCLGDVAFSKKHSGGFRESRDSQVETFDIITVEQAKNSKDDTFVVLQGYIDKSLGGEKYLFRDTTGTIKLKIDDDKFRGLVVYPDDFVQVSGEVDKNWWSETKVDVKDISKKSVESSSKTSKK